MTPLLQIFAIVALHAIVVWAVWRVNQPKKP